MSFRGEEDERSGRRIVTNTPAWLEGREGELVCCTLENIGHSGAQLCVSPDMAYPSRFTIRLTRDGKVKRVCRLIWHNHDRMGVRFVRTDGTDHPPT